MTKQNKILSGWKILILLVVLFGYFNLYFAQKQIDNIMLGKTIEFDSKILNEKREILIYTPAGFEQSNIRFPTLYIIDGAENFFIATAIVNFLARSGEIPRMVVVGIPNVNRDRDLSPSVIQGTSNRGEADNFLNFFQKELIPYINRTYKTANYRILFGHSLGGVFATHAMISRPDLFNAFIAASPFLAYDNGYIIKKRFLKIISPQAKERIMAV